jgi:hypothetical protein
MGKRNVYRVSVGNTEGKRPLGRSWYIWEHNIKMSHREIGRTDGLDLSGSGYGPREISYEYGNEPGIQ